MKKKRKLSVPKIPDLIRHVFLSWLIAALLEFLLVPSGINALEGVQGLAAMSLLRLVMITVAGTVGLWIVSCFYPIDKIERWSIVGVFFLLACAALDQSYTDAYLVFCGLILVILIVYAIMGHYNKEATIPEKIKTHWGFPVGVVVAAVAVFALICVWSVSRVLSFSCPNYDFGIFSQMFHNMKETGLPTTTVEREGALSHFKVHVSPIYYLILPVYWLFPDPITLQVMQALIITSSVIPMWLLGKQHGLTGLQRMLACFVLLLIPTTAGGAYYDLHENCFLLPLILWLMYAIDRRSILLSSLFAFLTLMVKEDAAVYVAVAALYLIVKTLIAFRREKWKELLLGIGMLIGALVWFKLVTDYLTNQGDGVMTYRYDNFMYGDSGSLISVVFAVFLNPMKMLFECVDQEKLEYIGQTMLPLLALPLLTRKYERYILLIPYILINLMSDYQYQHDVFFQYNFGSSAFLLYLTVVNLADLKKHLYRIIAIAVAAAVSVSCFTAFVFPRITEAAIHYKENKTYFSEVRESLNLVPDGASVSAGTFYIVPLSERKELYDVRYCSLEYVLETEYVVVRSTSSGDFKKYANGDENGYENFAAILKQNGYEIFHQKGSLVIYRKAAE